MGATPTAVSGLSIDVVHDLDSASALASQLAGDRNSVFQLTGEVLKYANAPVRSAAVATASGQVKLSAPAKWTLPNGICFSLTASSSCAFRIQTTSETLYAAATIDSDETSKITAEPLAGMVYINFDLDFCIEGNVSARAQAGTLGISGSLAGGRTATVTFCQPVPDALSTHDALCQALSQFVFPLDPASLLTMQTGALCRVLFDARFCADLNVSFGLGDHAFAAPGVASALRSAQRVVSMTPPSVVLKLGATGSLTYNHTDHFGLIVDKSSATLASVYLIRTLETDTGLSAGLVTGIAVTDVSVSVDPAALGGVVKKITSSDKLTNTVVQAASGPDSAFVSGLNSKLADWGSSIPGPASLVATLARQKSHTVLFQFLADLASPDLTQKSWSALLTGDLRDALHVGGLKLQPGSGISENLNRSAKLHFQFYNLFAFDSVNDFFSKSSVEIGPEGSIRLHAEIGDESKTSTKRSFSSFRTYFVVTAAKDELGTVSHTEVDLRLEFSEANRTGAGASFAGTLSLAPSSSTVIAARNVLSTFTKDHASGKLTLIFNVKPSVYTRFSFTPFTGTTPGPLPQVTDRANWQAFHDACNVNASLAFIRSLSFDTWASYNLACTDQAGSTLPPNRREIGSPAQGLSVLPDSSQRALQGYFLQASQGFMNLCEDLRTLADQATAVTDLDHYNKLLGYITRVTTEDLYMDYAVPAAGALLKLCTVAPEVQVSASLSQPTNSSAITCTLTVA